MHSKIIDPRRDGRFVFANRGSCSKTVSYLGHEARERGEAVRFFHQERTEVPTEEVKETMDANTKGLRKQQEKFYSLVLSPSQAELQHIKNDPEKLQAYTVKVMENYAANFHLNDGRRLSASDLLWYATIHQQRKEKEGEAKGKTKPGLHQHVHILVSAKDKTGEYRLNPKGRKSYFIFKDWQVKNGKTFQEMFDYRKPTVSEKLTAGMPEETKQRHQQRIRDKIAYLNEYLISSPKLSVEKALAMGKEQQYGKGFFFRLHHLTQQFQQGKLIHDPYQVLETGKDTPVRFPEPPVMSFAKSVKQLGNQVAEPEEPLGHPKKKQHRVWKHQSLER
uniref:DUF5712 family protein n=1 Tax=Roseihalotalea indica TaxID=2867963 RepID=A0AA49GPP1_9BACT|nr:DUF5712 family protein [Tunicatimonas sp. TK19036]